jgi:hypothetical protein
MVWRRVLVLASFALRELHGVIQVAMAWDGIHLFVFRLRAARYGSPKLSASSPDVTLPDLRFRKAVCGRGWTIRRQAEVESPSNTALLSHQMACSGSVWPFSRLRSSDAHATRKHTH